jgi:hypothetical protein
MENNDGTSPDFTFDMSSLLTQATSLSSVDDLHVIDSVMGLVHRAALAVEPVS